MLDEFRRILKPGGVLLISSPDREIITERAHTENEFHIHELSKKEFLNLIKQFFAIEEFYGQTKYKILPRYKKFIKAMAKLDVFKLHRFVVRVLGLKLLVHKTLAEHSYGSLERDSLESPNEFFVLLAICRKK
jgi:SAM-dependent methyltransferase